MWQCIGGGMIGASIIMAMVDIGLERRLSWQAPWVFICGVSIILLNYKP